MRRSTKLTAGGLVAFIVAVALLVSTPNVANAATATMNDYRQTLPASVIDTMTPDERTRWMEGTRAGNVGTGGSITPVRSTPGPRANLIRGGGAGTALLIGGQLISEASPATEGEWWRNSECSVFDLNGCKSAERPSHIDEDEWSKCGSGGSDVLGTLNDFASWWLGAGTDCNEIREGWGAERGADYDLDNPVGVAPPTSATLQGTHAVAGRGIQVGKPYWSDVIFTHSTRGNMREGWVFPVNLVGGVTGTQVAFRLTITNHSTGNKTTDPGLLPVGSASQTTPDVRAIACAGYTYCIAPNRAGWSTTVGTGSSQVPGALYVYPGSGAQGGWINPLPLQPHHGTVANGPPTVIDDGTEGLQEVNLVTTITTESGRTYTCRTQGFVESASWVPAPCNPTWAEPDEVITERIVEVVPVRENPTHVPYSNPSREVERTTVPQPVRDQQRENSECSTSTCYVEVMVQRPDGVWVACSKYPELCRDWKRTTETKPTAHPFRCEYNFKVVDLAECRHLARLFEPGAIEGGTAYPDPSEEGQPGYHPSNPPGSQTSTSPGPATAPGTAVRDPEKQRQCFPTGWGVLNPVEWVYRPVMCALEDAFVPRTSFVQGLLRDLTNRLDGKAPMILMTAMQGWSFDVPSGCSGINVPFGQLGIPGVSDFRVLDACSDPLVVNLANWSKIAVTVIFAVGSTFATVRNIGAIFAYNTGNSA